MTTLCRSCSNATTTARLVLAKLKQLCYAQRNEIVASYTARKWRKKNDGIIRTLLCPKLSAASTSNRASRIEPNSKCANGQIQQHCTRCHLIHAYSRSATAAISRTLSRRTAMRKSVQDGARNNHRAMSRCLKRLVSKHGGHQRRSS